MIRWVRWGLYGLILWTPLPFGSVQPWAVLTIQLVCASLVAIALARAADRPFAPIELVVPLSATALAVVGLIQLTTGATLSPTDTSNATLRLTSYALLAFLVVSTVRTEREVSQMTTLLVVSGGFNACYGILEFITGHQHIFGFRKLHYLDSATGTFINRNHFAILLATLLPLALERIRTSLPQGPQRQPTTLRHHLRVLGFSLCALMMSLAILVSFSRTGLAVATIAVASWFGLSREPGARRFLTLAPIVAAVLLLTIATVYMPGARFAASDEVTTLNNRLPVWGAAIPLLSHHPFAGLGLGAFEAYFTIHKPAGTGGVWDHAHNDWLELFLDGGGWAVLMMIAVTWAYSSALRRHRCTSRPQFVAALIALCVASGVDFAVRIPAIATTSTVLVVLALSPSTSVSAESLRLWRPRA